MRRKKYNQFDFGWATVKVTRATLDLDKFFRGYYRCDVTPKNGPFFRCWLRADTREDAAKAALLDYENTR